MGLATMFGASWRSLALFLGDETPVSSLSLYSGGKRWEVPSLLPLLLQTLVLLLNQGLADLPEQTQPASQASTEH